MQIKVRYKDSNGRTIAYLIQDGNKQERMPAEIVQQLSNFVENARLLENGEFRAIEGEKIDTQTDVTNLKIDKKLLPVKKSVVVEADLASEFYGQEYINICKKIRMYALKGAIRFDKATTPHGGNDGKNTHLFKLIEACGISKEEFMLGYLSVIQPYSLSSFQHTKEPNDQKWMCDIGYKVSLIIKIEKWLNGEIMTVSFHESNIHGNFNWGSKDFSDKLCAVIVDKVKEYEGRGYKVGYTVQRGFIKEQIKSTTQYYKNGIALVKYSDIKETYDDLMTLLFDKIRGSYCDENLENIRDIRPDTKLLSFLSIGYTPINNINLLIDSFGNYKDQKSRVAIAEMTNNILSEMPPERLVELKIALKDKFGIEYNNELYKLIMST